MPSRCKRGRTTGCAASCCWPWGTFQARGGEAASWKETFVEAAAVARRLNAPEQLARAALGYGGRFVWFRAGRDQRLIPLLEDALEALPAPKPVTSEAPRPPRRRAA